SRRERPLSGLFYRLGGHLCRRDQDGELRTFLWSGLDINRALMRVDDLIHQREPQAGAALKLRLKRLKDLLQLLRFQSDAGILEAKNQLVVPGVYSDLEPSAVWHRAHRVIAQIPENLLHTIRVDHGRRTADAKISYDRYLSGSWIIFEQGNRFI